MGMSVEEQRVRFCGRFPPEMSWAALLPGGMEFAYSLPAAMSLQAYFRGQGHLVGPPDIEHVVRYFFPDLPYLAETPERVSPGGEGIRVDLLWNLRRHEAVSEGLYHLLSPHFRVSANGLLPRANIQVQIAPEHDEFRFREVLLSSFNVPLKPFRPTISQKDRAWVQGLLVSRGYTRDSALIFLEADLSVDHRFREKASRALGRPVFFVTRRAGGDLIYPSFGFSQTLTLLSLADLYLGDGGFFLGFAQLLEIPVVLTRKPPIIVREPVLGPFRDPLEGLRRLRIFRP